MRQVSPSRAGQFFPAKTPAALRDACRASRAMASQALSEEGNAALLDALRDSGTAAAREERVLALLAAALPRGVTPVPAPRGDPYHADSPSRGKAPAAQPASYWTPQQLQLAQVPPQQQHGRGRAASPSGVPADDLALALVEERVHWRAEAARVGEEARRVEEEREALRESADALSRARDAFRAECAMERAATEAERREVADALSRLEARVCRACARVCQCPQPQMRRTPSDLHACVRSPLLVRLQADARVAASEHAALEVRACVLGPHSLRQLRKNAFRPVARDKTLSSDRRLPPFSTRRSGVRCPTRTRRWRASARCSKRTRRSLRRWARRCSALPRRRPA
jgi:hypothetical protein